ncbi:MAG TPA: hypothetical protein VF103_13785, partial [Polyangiaceae bacterium]
GEGVRVAYNEYRAAGSPWPARIGAVTVRGIFEIGPVDGGVPNSTFNASETRWNVLLPGCDWDIRDLEGMKPFDRMLQVPESAPASKSTFHVWGASHNFYNTEWQQVDGHISGGCINHAPIYSAGDIGSAFQRQTGLFSALSFFTANVGTNTDAGAAQLFDPVFPIAPAYRVDRSYHPGGDVPASKRLEDFVNASGTSSYGLPNETSGQISVDHRTADLHDPSLKAAFIDWQNPSPSTYFQTNFAPAGSGFDLTSYQNLDLRVDRFGIDETPPVTFFVALVNGNGALSSLVPISDFLAVNAPARGQQTLPTARIPLSRFTGATLASIRAVRFVFSTSSLGPILIANVRATRTTTSTTLMSLAEPAALAPTSPMSLGSSAVAPSALAGSQTAMTLASLAPDRIASGNQVVSIRARGADAVEIALSSQTYFAPRAHRLVLSVGSESSSSAEQPDGNLYAVRFVLPRAAWDRVKDGEPLSVGYGKSSPVVWEFGLLDKTKLNR